MLFKTKKLLNSYFVLQVLIIYVILKMSTIMAIEMGAKNREISSAVLLSGAEAELVKKGNGEFSFFLSGHNWLRLLGLLSDLMTRSLQKLDTIHFIP